MSYTNNGSGAAIIEENNYYPFGLKHEGYNTLIGNPAYNYGYNGKELQKETGYSDFGARMYMSDIGRWGVVDALAEQMRRHSPYNYAFNNPLRFIDPDGNSPQDTYGEHSAFNGDFDPNSSLSGYNGMGGSHGNYFASNTGGGGGSAWGYDTKTFGETQAFRDLMAGNTSSITNSNGYFTYWTGAMSSSGSQIGDEMNVEYELGVFNRIPLGDLPLDAYKNWADWGSTAMGGGFKYLADQRTSFYNRGNWVDNLGNVRSTAYAGRAVDSQIGLRSSYLRTTAMYGKYAKRAGYVGYAISAAQITYGVYQDDGKFGVRAQVATANVAGGMAGAAAGAWLGAKILTPIGGAIGVAFFGVGAAPGAAIGGAIGGIAGGILGGIYGGDYAEEVASGILNKPDY
ncbi:RHS repeat protein [Chryseobacterium lathyri]|uniref:RHS repeat protein n=1 Tax=Chryseobacterium lathyri TaxID=395933 RepID=UPI002780FC41|nr:RHS repeat-associated protein [Chryseobacterium lathyri]